MNAFIKSRLSYVWYFFFRTINPTKPLWIFPFPFTYIFIRVSWALLLFLYCRYFSENNVPFVKWEKKPSFYRLLLPLIQVLMMVSPFIFHCFCPSKKFRFHLISTFLCNTHVFVFEFHHAFPQNSIHIPTWSHRKTPYLLFLILLFMRKVTVITNQVRF